MVEIIVKCTIYEGIAKIVTIHLLDFFKVRQKDCLNFVIIRIGIPGEVLTLGIISNIPADLQSINKAKYGSG